MIIEKQSERKKSIGTIEKWSNGRTVMPSAISKEPTRTSVASESAIVEGKPGITRWGSLKRGFLWKEGTRRSNSVKKVDA